MKKGFVTLTNENPKYKALVDVLVESVLEFTDLEIEVVGINFDYKHSNKRVIPKRLSLNSENFEAICFSKIKSCMISDFDVTMHVDSDIVVGPQILDAFDFYDHQKDIIKFPRHPWDGPLEQRHTDCMNYVGAAQKTQPYVHAATFLFSKNAKEFLSEAYEYSQKMIRDDFHPINQDETIFNCLLWKNSATDHYTDCYDPYYEIFKSKIGMKVDSQFSHLKPYTNIENYVIHYCLGHGCKDPIEARHILDKLIELRNNR